MLQTRGVEAGGKSIAALGLGIYIHENHVICNSGLVQGSAREDYTGSQRDVEEYGRGT